MKALANKALWVASAILVSEGVVSGEFGANQREMTEQAKHTLAVAEISTKSNWVKLPKENKVSAQEMRILSARNNHISAQVDQLLQSRLEQKFAPLHATVR
ncbi:MAG: hypothetical protein KTR17_01035 [Cellvibrionaceae bacterium]|nr:hypothetical protein [Cellvibrionaceae bacterium]